MNESEKRRDLAADRVFNLRKRNAAKILKGITIKTAGSPMQGPWYWLWLKPKWILKAMPISTTQMQDEFGSIDHPAFWRTLVDQFIVPHYKLTDPTTIREVKNLPYAMPRGRVASQRKLGGGPQWVAWHGNDFKYNRTEMLAVLSAFDLMSQFQAGLVRFLPDDHEIVIRHDFERFNQLVAPIDKKRVKIQDPGPMDDD